MIQACPHCRGRIEFSETTDERQRQAGLVYLSAKCFPCDSRFDAAGVGFEDAKGEAVKILKKRIGTHPNRWKIRPGRTRRRRSYRR